MTPCEVTEWTKALLATALATSFVIGVAILMALVIGAAIKDFKRMWDR